MILTLMLGLWQASAEPPCSPGFHLNNGETVQPIAEKLTDHRKIGNLVGASFFGGLLAGPMTVKTVLNGPAAEVRTKTARPSFLFCAQASDAASSGAGRSGEGMGYVGTRAVAESPREFRLVRFDAKGKQREVVLSAAGVFVDQGKAALKTIVRFDVEEIGAGRYRVTPMQDLTAGEYGFLRTTGNTTAANGKRAAPEHVYDFAVE